MTSRQLPMLEITPPQPTGRRGPKPEDRLDEFATDDLILPRFHLWTLGCQMNRSDSEEMAGALLEAGCAEAPDLESAELIVINSCAIREAAEQKVIGRMGLLGKLKRSNPAVRVVLTGCSVRADNQDELQRRYPAIDLFLRPDQEPELVARLGLAGATSPGDLADTPTSAPTFQRVGRSVTATADRLPASRAAALDHDTIARSSRTHAWLPIIYGCDKTCTYCIVPFSRGPERSRPFDDVIAEARRLAAAGYQEVTLLGQNVNSYGHDLEVDPRFSEVQTSRTIGRQLALDGKPDIAALLRAIDGIRTADGVPAIPRLRFITSHPWDLTDRLIAAMAESPSVCEHLHLPVQSGDDGTLRQMGRQYTVDSYLALVDRLRRTIPEICLTTDVIVGFCGESEAAFERTLDLLRLVRFDGVFAAAFSPRPGTPAARLVDDVPAPEKHRRLNALLALQEEINGERNAAWVGRETEVLVERVRPARSHDHDDDLIQLDGRRSGADRSQSTRLVGRNRANKLVHFGGPAELVGRRVMVRVDRSGPYALSGRWVLAEDA